MYYLQNQEIIIISLLQELLQQKTNMVSREIWSHEAAHWRLVSFFSEMFAHHNNFGVRFGDETFILEGPKGGDVSLLKNLLEEVGLGALLAMLDGVCAF